MNYEIVGKGSPAKIAILVPKIQVSEISKHYMPILSKLNQEIMICDLYINRKKKKTNNTEIKEYLNDLLPNLIDNGIEILIVCQPDYFKVLSKQRKTDTNIGDIFTGIGDFKVTYCPHYSRIFRDPEKTKAKIVQGLESVIAFVNTGTAKKLGSDIIHQATYPSTITEKLDWLNKLIKMDCDLSCDIEGFSLKHFDAGIGTITFCWNQHEGVAFEIDNCSTKAENSVLRIALKDFFYRFRKTKKKMIYHNICYDVYVLIYQLFMDDILDQEGLLEGLDVMLTYWECSQIITYLATNSCAGNELGLKIQAQEFAGNYAVEEINDITQIPLPKLLEYNLIDGLSTWFVYNKHYQTMINDQQLGVYEHFKEWVVDIIQMQLTGLPINMDKVVKLNDQLTTESEYNVRKMKQTKIVQGFIYQLEEDALVKKNTKLKTKIVSRKDLGKTKDLEVDFNPNSAPQLQRLLYSKEFLELPIIDTTDSGLPSTGADTLEKLINQQISEEIKDFLQILLEYKASAIILSTFLPAFLKACPGPDGWHYLFGNFRLGGTLSGRLSCVHGFTKIQTDNGLIPICQMNSSSKVLSHTGEMREVSHVFTKGIDQMYDITLCNGEVLTCTNDHKLLCADGTWKTLREIQNVYIQKMGIKPRQHSKYFGSISKYETPNYGGDCHTTDDNISQCELCDSKEYSRSRKKSSWKTSIFSIKNWFQKSNEGEDRRSTPQLDRGVGRWLWLQNYYLEWKTKISAPCKNDGEIRNNPHTKGDGCSSHRQQSTQQRVRQSSSCDKGWSSDYPLLAGEGQQTVRIKKIDLGPISTVWDCTVEIDHSYQACGVFSHNSNNPNLQNIPSSAGGPLKSRLAKLIKECFEAPLGWIFVGLDFDSLEDRISALQTKDPNKMKVYTDGFDGHCLRALAYFGEHMSDIEMLPDGEQAYKMIAGGKEIYFHSNEEIDYKGQKLLGSELFALINKEITT